MNLKDVSYLHANMVYAHLADTLIQVYITPYLTDLVDCKLKNAALPIFSGCLLL